MAQRPIFQRVSERERLRKKAADAIDIAQRTAAKHNQLMANVEKLDHRCRLEEFSRQMLQDAILAHARLPWWQRTRKRLEAVLGGLEEAAFEKLQGYAAATFLGKFFRNFWMALEAKRDIEAAELAEAETAEVANA